MFVFSARGWMISNIETVLFDKDGTFIDLHYFWGKMTELRAREVIKRYSLERKMFDILCYILGYDYHSGRMLPDGITALYSRVKIIEIFRDKLSELGINATEEELTEIFDDVANEFYNDIERYTKPIDEAVEFIKKLRSKGAKIGIVTSDSVESANLTLKQFGWENLFDVVIGRESSSETKESGALTKIALEKLNADPFTTLMIGDAPMDAISAKNAGIEKTILVASGQMDKNELEEYSEYVIYSLKDLQCLRI